MKVIKLSAIAAVIAASSSSYAADVDFSGTVSAITCNASVTQNGVAVNGAINLGTVAPGTTGSDVAFELSPDLTQAGCSGLTSTNTVKTTWSGAFNATGLTASASSAASDAKVLLTTVNASSTAQSDVVSGGLVKEFAGDVFKANGAKFKAKLVGGTQTGSFASTATYTMSYL